MCIHKLELNFSDFCDYSCILEIKFLKKKHIKILVKCSRFVSSITFEHCFLRIQEKALSNKTPVLTKSMNMGI